MFYHDISRFEEEQFCSLRRAWSSEPRPNLISDSQTSLGAKLCMTQNLC